MYFIISIRSYCLNPLILFLHLLSHDLINSFSS